MELDPAVYLRTNRKHNALYLGVTNNLFRRDWEHRNGKGGSFSSRYNMTLLVWFKRFALVTEVITEEKRLKGASRADKVALIESINPEWKDLGADWHEASYNPIASSWLNSPTSFETPAPRNDALGK